MSLWRARFGFCHFIKLIGKDLRFPCIANFGLCRTTECGLHMVVGWPLAIDDRENKSKSDKLSSFLPSSIMAEKVGHAHFLAVFFVPR